MRKQDGGHLREELILAGIEEIEAHGVRGFSLRRVAKKCGVSCAAPYKHFADLNDFLLAIGFMGTGKSSVGRRIAARLGMKFLDSDAEIEKSAGMEIKDIFAKFGEEKFREMERKFIESGHPDSGCVVSCGGGLCCRDGMPELVRGRGVCVVLFSTPEEICERVSKSDKRPLVNVENPILRIRELLALRTPYYMRSGIAIAADKNIKSTVEHVERIYRACLRRRRARGQQ